MTEIEVNHTIGLAIGELSPTAEETERIYTKICPFGPYNIMFRVTEDDKLVDIVEVQVSKEFLSVKQKIESSGSYDVMDLYET